MYVKIIGSVMVIVSSSLIGFKMNENAKSRIEELKTIKNIVTMLRGEIKYNNATVSEALKKIAEKTSGNFKTFLLGTADELIKNQAAGMDKIWSKKVKEAFKSNTCLTKKDLNDFALLGNSIGKYDVESQIKAFDLFLEEMNEKIEIENQKAMSDGKLYKCMGIMAGVFIVLMIV